MFRRSMTLILLCFLLATNADASVVITFHGTVNNDEIGLYNLGDNVSYSFYLNPSYDPLNSNAFRDPGNSLYWDTETTSHSLLLSNVTGSQLTGSWASPSLNPDSPYHAVEVSFGTSGQIGAYTSADSLSESVGLQANGIDVNSLSFQGNFIGLNLTDPGFLENPTSYLMSYVGTYLIDNSNSPQGLTIGNLRTTDNRNIFFEITSVEISSTPSMGSVPEPSSILAWSGLVVLLLVRRRFK